MAVTYLVLAPSSPDLAAASYRSDLFSRVGFTLWDNSWYGGHHLPAYSLLAPALGALLGPRLLVALAVVAAGGALRTAAGPRDARHARPRGVIVVRLRRRLRVAVEPRPLRPRPGARAGGAAPCPPRVRCGAGAVPAVLAGEPGGGGVPGAGAASPGRSRARGGGWRCWMALAALVPIGLLALLFPEGGTQPFVLSAFWAPAGGRGCCWR